MKPGGGAQGTRRIDGVVAAVATLSRLMVLPDRSVSPYAYRGVRVVGCGIGSHAQPQVYDLRGGDSMPACTEVVCPSINNHGFPMNRPASTPLDSTQTELTLGARVPLRIEATLHAAGVTARATVRGGGTAVLELRTRPPWDGTYPVWSLAAGAPCRSSRSDELRAWTDSVYRTLKDVVGARGDATREWDEDDAAELRATMRSLTAVAGRMGVHAAATCDPEARKAALRFSPTARAWVYRRIVDDRTGRVGQLAAAVPGPLVFAAGAAAIDGFPSVSRIVIDDAVAGVPARTLVVRVVEAWAQDAEQRGRIQRPEVTTPNLFDGFGHLHGDADEAAAAVERQRRFVRRIGRLVAPALAVLPPPLLVTDVDIPEAPRDNARWVRIVKAAPRLQMPGAPVELQARRAVAAFLSRRALTAFPRGRHTRPIRRRVEELIDYVQATGRRPGRSSDPERVFAEARRWHLEFQLAETARRKREDILTPDSHLPPPRISAWSDADGNRLAPLTSLHQLRRESTEMRHCVESYVDLVRGGVCDIVAGIVAAGRLTIEVRYPRGRPEIAQVRGPGNANPTRAQRMILGRWIADSTG